MPRPRQHSSTLVARLLTSRCHCHCNNGVQSLTHSAEDFEALHPHDLFAFICLLRSGASNQVQTPHRQPALRPALTMPMTMPEKEEDSGFASLQGKDLVIEWLVLKACGQMVCTPENLTCSQSPFSTRSREGQRVVRCI